jgi:hypothetical protein
MKNWLLTGVFFYWLQRCFLKEKLGIVTDGQNSIVGANIAIKGSELVLN